MSKFIFSKDSNQGKTYHAAAALLDRRDPRKVIGHLKKPLFSPGLEWECRGVVDRVVFPTGTAVFGKRLYIYYGAADKVVAAASINLNGLVEDMLENGVRQGFVCFCDSKSGKRKS